MPALAGGLHVRTIARRARPGDGRDRRRLELRSLRRRSLDPAGLRRPPRRLGLPPAHQLSRSHDGRRRRGRRRATRSDRLPGADPMTGQGARTTPGSTGLVCGNAPLLTVALMVFRSGAVRPRAARALGAEVPARADGALYYLTRVVVVELGILV